MEILQIINQPQLMSSKTKRGTVFNNKISLFEKLDRESLHFDTGLVDLSSSLSQELLVQLLTHGNPKAYIELFELTQESEIKGEGVGEKDKIVKSHANVWKQILGDKERMQLLKDLLEVIEITSKSGPLDKLFEAQFQIGSIFDDVHDMEKSIFYYSNSLIIAKQIGHPRYEAQVKVNLGKVYQKMHAHYQAMQCFEDFISIANSMNDTPGIIDVSQNLLEVYIKCAEKAYEANNLHTSIEYYNKCVELANIGANVKIAAEAKHKLGLLHYQLQQPLIALEYQTSYLSYCDEVKDKIGKAMGHAAAAQVFSTLENIEGEIYHLENLLDVAKLIDKKTEAQAYCKLGMAYTQQCQLDYATIYFEQFYKLACELKDVNMLACASINLGISRCAPAIL